MTDYELFDEHYIFLLNQEYEYIIASEPLSIQYYNNDDDLPF